MDLTAEATGTHTLKDNNLQEWVKKTRVNIDNNKTVYDVMKIVLNANHITWKESNKRGTVYIESLTRNGVTIGEFDNGTLSGWMYTLNGHHPNLGVAQQFLDGEEDISSTTQMTILWKKALSIGTFRAAALSKKSRMSQPTPRQAQRPHRPMSR